mmetsp:Transcript_78027/g.253183  ORF Transcript_78027/g.253183 Transcript_78027/m.253183 type:complete len:291 (-) Transcript_78027:624-1496(-)
MHCMCIRALIACAVVACSISGLWNAPPHSPCFDLAFACSRRLMCAGKTATRLPPVIANILDEEDSASRSEPLSPTSSCSTDLPRLSEEVDTDDVQHWVEMPAVAAPRDQDGITPIQIMGTVPEQLIGSIADSSFKWTAFAAVGLSSARCSKTNISNSSSDGSKSFVSDAVTLEFKKPRKTAENVVFSRADGLVVPRPAAGPLSSVLRRTAFIVLCPLALVVVAIGLCVLVLGSVASILFCFRSLLCHSRVAAQPHMHRREALQSGTDMRHPVAKCAGSPRSSRLARQRSM